MSGAQLWARLFPPEFQNEFSPLTVIFQLTSQVIKIIFQYSLADISYSSAGVSFL